MFSYSGLQFASLLDGVNVFGKEEIVAQTNIFRRVLGLGELKENATLNAAAMQKLQDMAQKEYFAHTSPSGTSPWYWIEANQYKYSYAGENLAIGFFTAKDTVDAWANSPSHRANLANSNYKEIGVAVAPVKIQNNEGFLVVQLFGTPKPQATPKTAVKPPVVAQVSPTPFPPTPKPTAIQTPAISASPVVRSDATENIEKPTVVQVGNVSPRLENLADKLNITLILYLLAAFLISAMFLAFRGLQKNLVVETAANLAILVLAIIVPLVKITHSALIL